MSLISIGWVGSGVGIRVSVLPLLIIFSVGINVCFLYFSFWFIPKATPNYVFFYSKAVAVLGSDSFPPFKE